MTSIRELWLSAKLTAITGAQILISIGMQWYIVSRVGAGEEADAFYAGATVFQIARSLFLDTLRTVLTPLFSDKSEADLRDAAWRCVIVAAAVATAVAGLLGALVPMLVPLLVPGFSEQAQTLTIRLSLFQLAALPGAAVYSVLGAACVARHQFSLPPAANLAGVLVGLFFVLWALPHSGIEAAGVAIAAVSVVPGLLLLPVLGISMPSPFWCTDELRQVWNQLRPLIAGRAYFLTNIPVDRLLVSYMPAGSLATFEFAARVSSVILTILDVSSIGPAMPRLTKLATAGDWASFRTLARRKAVECFVCSVVLLGAGYAVLTTIAALGAAGAYPAIFGKLGSTNLSTIGTLILYMAAILPFTSISQVLAAAFSARRDNAKLTKIAAVVFTVTVPMRVVGFWIARIPGIVVVTGVAGLVYCLALSRYLHVRPADSVLPRTAAAAAAEVPNGS